MKLTEVTLLALRLGLGGLFTVAGLVKLLAIEEFSLEIEQYEILPVLLSAPFAVCLSLVESGAGLGVFLGLRTRASAYTIAILSGLFTVALGVNLLRGNLISCGCFGILGKNTISTASILRNVLIFAASLTIASVRSHPLSADLLLGRASSSPPIQP